MTFESWCERDHLILLDFDPEVAAVAAQPFSLSFEASDGSRREHVPDSFVRMVNGAAVVVDVRPDNPIGVMDEEKFAATAELCAGHGWAYRRVGEIPSQWMDNVRWLAGYRHDRVRTTSIADAVRAITAVASAAIPLGVLADPCSRPRTSTLDIVERGSDHIARHVVRNHRPEGAFDPYLRALQITPFGLALPSAPLPVLAHPMPAGTGREE